MPIRNNNDTLTKQAFRHQQGWTGPGVPAGVIYGARRLARDEAGRDAGGGGLAQWVAFVKRGCFKYMVHNNEENKDYCIKDYFLPRGIGIKYSNP